MIISQEFSKRNSSNIFFINLKKINLNFPKIITKTPSDIPSQIPSKILSDIFDIDDILVILPSVSLGHHPKFPFKTSKKIKPITSPEMPKRIS